MDKNIDYILEVALCGGITKAAENRILAAVSIAYLTGSQRIPVGRMVSLYTFITLPVKVAISI
ncbi:MAG: hypothetical protein E7232_03570 [Lachnospiraceae bacterium]|nr:hypothetical protein [Lachnospiraceae bacterium]